MTLTREQSHAQLPAATSWIGGVAVTGAGADTPFAYAADESPLGRWALAGSTDVDAAVSAASAAAPGWGASRGSERRDALFAASGAIRADEDRLAGVMSLEMGMPLRAARAGVRQAAEWFAYYAGWADKLGGQSPAVDGRVHDYTRLSAYPVVGAIIPWNGPVVAAALKLAPALAAGCCVVLKPSELAPFAAVLLAEVLGLPPGVVNVVGGGPDAGARLVEHPDVAMISFTGGDLAGARVGAAAAARHVPCVLELGGKSAAVVFDDADPQRVGRLAVLLGTVQNSGQGCFLPTRLLVQRGIYDRVLDAVRETAAGIVPGDPYDPQTAMGPVVNAAARDRIFGIIDGADARLVAGGVRPAGPGAYVPPTVFADVDPASDLAQQEVFGPVLAVTPFADEDEAVAVANGTRFGLAGYVWTHDLARAHRVADRLDAGYISVNGLAGLPPGAPFGGWKASGHGTEGGLTGIREYQRTKNVHVQL